MTATAFAWLLAKTAALGVGFCIVSSAIGAAVGFVVNRWSR